MSEYPVIVPDDLLAWGKIPEVAVHFARPWAHDVEKLVAKGELNHRETKMLMARLEALCVEAVRAGRGDLLSGLDTRTAELLGISYTIVDGDRKIEIGRGKRYAWSEMRAVLATDHPKSALAAVDRVKDLLAEAFPGARISEVSDREAQPPQACGSCGTTTGQVMMTTTYGTHHCGPCWSLMTDVTPVNTKHTTNGSSRGRR
jgi:hypothetical protein